jgi:hypothetical protein
VTSLKHITDLATEAAKNGNWERAIHYGILGQRRGEETLKHLPQYHLPWSAIGQLLDSVGKQGFHPAKLQDLVFELTNNLPDEDDGSDAAIKSVSKLMEMGGEDHYTKTMLSEHPAGERYLQANRFKGPADFFYKYEKSVDPEHFATAHHWLSKSEEPVAMQDHRGKQGSSANWQHILPHLDDYAKAAQDAIKKHISLHTGKPVAKNSGHFWDEGEDTWVQSPHTGFTEPHVFLYRGVMGNYGWKILDAAEHDLTGMSSGKKSVELPFSPISSWSADYGVAHNFAATRKIKGQAEGYGTVIGKWFPISQVVHSGWHDAFPGQKHAHPGESEFVLKHPDGRMKIHSKEVVARHWWKSEDVPDVDNVEWHNKIRQELRLRLADVNSKANGTYDWKPVAVKHFGWDGTGDVKEFLHDKTGMHVDAQDWKGLAQEIGAVLDKCGPDGSHNTVSILDAHKRLRDLHGEIGKDGKTLDPPTKTVAKPAEVTLVQVSPKNNTLCWDKLRQAPPKVRQSTPKAKQPKDPVIKFEPQFEDYLHAAESLSGEKHNPDAVREAKHNNQDVLAQALLSVGC